MWGVADRVLVRLLAAGDRRWEPYQGAPRAPRPVHATIDDSSRLIRFRVTVYVGPRQICRVRVRWTFRGARRCAERLVRSHDRAERRHAQPWQVG